MAIDRNQPAGEGCIRAADGTISDAAFHDLDDDPPMSRAEAIRLRERARERGMPEAEIDRYFPVD